MPFIGGSINISHNHSLTSIIQLNNIDSVSGRFLIIDNDALINLSGLNNVSFISGDLHIGGNDGLTSLSGLNSVTNIAGGLIIRQNNALVNLNELFNISNIAGDLEVKQNSSLTSLTGLDNIEAASIENLKISSNLSLTTCDVESICSYLAAPNGEIEIFSNASGCNSQTEVEEACDEAAVSDITFASTISLYPNPASQKLHIKVCKGIKIKEVFIYNQFGQKVLIENLITNIIDVSILERGSYIIELVTEEYKIREKLIIK